jgi:hypothetical protein
MLYQERVLGRRSLWSWIVAGLAIKRRKRRVADVDLLSMTPHLRRDLGLLDGEAGLRRH